MSSVKVFHRVFIRYAKCRRPGRPEEYTSSSIQACSNHFQIWNNKLETYSPRLLLKAQTSCQGSKWQQRSCFHLLSFLWVCISRQINEVIYFSTGWWKEGFSFIYKKIKISFHENRTLFWIMLRTDCLTISGINVLCSCRKDLTTERWEHEKMSRGNAVRGGIQWP